MQQHWPNVVLEEASHANINSNRNCFYYVHFHL